MARGREPVDVIELFGLLKRRITALATQAYAEAGMVRIQGKMLSHIGRHDRISQAELARATDTDAALTGRTLRALIEDGLVRRSRSYEDRREYVLELTAAGRRAKERVDAARAALAERLRAILDERDIKDFERVVTKMLAGFEAS
jgi:DNA-binding MarR family transcriptional regulator